MRRDALLAGLPSEVVADISGHTPRRSGAKVLARLGVAKTVVQWLGRWGSDAVEGYVEVAWAEVPTDLRLSQSAEHGSDMVVAKAAIENVLVAEVSKLRENLASDSAKSAGVDSRFAEVDAQLAELRDCVRPCRSRT